MSSVLLQIRAAQENERGPLYMEPALSALHSLKGVDRSVNLEIGMHDSKIAFFVRASARGMQLAESQLYAQYPDIEIDHLTNDPFVAGDDEEVMYLDLKLEHPEVYAIKRHPQFDDMLSRVNVDPIAGITSTLAHYEVEGMRGHVQISMQPMSNSYRRRALRFLPFLQKGFSGVSERYARFFARMQLARGWRRIIYLPVAVLMGGFRAWPGVSKFFSGTKVSLGSGEVYTSSDPEEEELQRASARTHDREDAVGGAQDKVNRLLFLCNIRLSVIGPKGQQMAMQHKLEEMAGSFRQFALPESNEFIVGKPQSSLQIPNGIQKTPYALSVEEISTMWHLPILMVQTPNLDWVLSKKLEPPSNLPLADDAENDVTVLGEAVFRGHRKKFGIKPDDRRRHMYIIGKTGMGKSTLLENMVFSDIHNGKGVGVIDPHGDLIEAIMQFIPKNRSNDVVLFDPSDKEHPVSFNVLDCKDQDQRTLTASGIMSVFTKLWPDVWSGRMEHILRNTLLALLEYEGSSMLGIMRIYADPAYRQKVVDNISDPVVKSFWVDEYASWSEKYRTEAISAIQNKVGQLLSTPLIRNIVGQVKSKLDIRHAMDTGKIVLVNLSKGKLGEDTSAFLGSMLVTKFQIDAMSRADIAEEERRDFYLYVDEFQNFATESFATILSEARKYRLSLTMANQYVSQLLIGEQNTALRDAVFGNVGTLLSFQVGSDDAEVLSLQFEEAATVNDILSLPKYHTYMRLMVDGMPSKPFSVSMLPPPEFEQDPGRGDVLRELSRQRYSEDQAVVEEKIRKWASSASEAKAGAKKEEKAKEKEEEERKRAKKKGMSLEDYRVWRDREMWLNDFNMLRKKKLLEEGEWTDAEEAEMQDLHKKLEGSGGVPEVSKTLQQQIDKKNKK